MYRGGTWDYEVGQVLLVLAPPDQLGVQVPVAPPVGRLDGTLVFFPQQRLVFRSGYVGPGRFLMPQGFPTDLPTVVLVLLGRGILLTSSGVREGIERLSAQTLNVLYVSSHQGQIMHLGGGGQKAVDHGNISDVVTLAPGLGNVGVN